MAPRLKYAAVAAAACLLVIVAIQTTQPAVWNSWRRYEGSVTPEYRKLAAEARDAALLYHDYMVLDSVIPRLPRSSGLVVEQSPTTWDDPARVRALVDEQMKGSTPPKSRIGLFIVDHFFGIVPSAVMAAQVSTKEIFDGVDSAGPYCAVIYTLPTPPMRDQKVAARIRYVPERDYDEVFPKTNLMGGCDLWSRYGAPGPHVRNWLRSTWYRFAQTPSNELWDSFRDQPDAFIVRNMSATADGDLCRRGNRGACLTAIDIPAGNGKRLAAASFAGSPYVEFSRPVFGRNEGAMLAHVEREFGPEKFARFWQSSEKLDVAFRNAFGVALDDWVRDWARKYYGVVSTGPRMSFITILTSILAVVMFAIFSINIARARKPA